MLPDLPCLIDVRGGIGQHALQVDALAVMALRMVGRDAVLEARQHHLAQVAVESLAALNAVTAPVDLALMLGDEESLEGALDAVARDFLRPFDVDGHGAWGNMRF